MQLIDQRIIFRGTPGTPTANCCFTALARLPDGTYLVTWRVGSQKDSADGSILLSRSADNGRTWSSPEKLPLGPFAEMECEPHYAPLTVLSDGRILAAIMWVDRSNPGLPFFHPDTEGLLPTRTLFCESHDAGCTWSNYRVMDAAPYHSPMPITGPVLPLAGGELACQFEVNKNYDDPQQWRHAAAWKISRDGGQTWPECVEVAHDPAERLMYWDARYALAPDGFCLATFWTYDRNANRDANIHLSVSHDHGRHWSPPQDTELVGQIAHPVFLADGRLVLIYIDRFRTGSIRAVMSDDMGKSFHGEIVVFEQPRNQLPLETSTTADYLQEMDAWAFGRIDALTDSDGQISTVFYSGNRDASNVFLCRLAT